MKHTKMLALAMGAAAILTAFAGASTASATVLCRNKLNPELCSERWAAGQEVNWSNEGIVKITTEFKKNIECMESSVAWKIEEEGAEHMPVKGNVTTLTLKNCNCEVTVLKNGSLETNWIEGTENGDLFSSGAEITSICNTVFGNVHCIYATNNTFLGKLNGGNPARVSISGANIPRLPTNTLCKAKGELDASYEVTAPKPLYVASK